MKREAVLSKNPDVVVRELPDSEGAVLLNIETGAYHGLNATGLVVWMLIDGVSTVQGLVDAARDAMAGAPDSLETDVITFLEGALERDLVRAAPASS
jgi:hypothetical protein